MENQTNEIKEEQKNIQADTQDNNKDWMEIEAVNLEKDNMDGEKLPALKLEENKITRIVVDFSYPFRTWTSPEGVTKKLIPVEHNGEKKIFWLNTRNPLYKRLITQGRAGVTGFSILQTGTQKNTKYTLVEE